MKKVPFYQLPRSVQERFVSATRGQVAPQPLAIDRRVPRRYLHWFGASTLFGAATGGLLYVGFGSLTSSLALAPAWVAAATAIGSAASLVSFMRGLVIYDRALGLPFRRGIYLFPSAVVEASGEVLHVHPMVDLQDTETSANSLSLTFASSSFTFPGLPTGGVPEVEQALKRNQERERNTEPPRSVRERAELDPLLVTDFPAPLSSTRPMQPTSRKWTHSLLAAAAVAGLGLGLGLYRTRNLWSEQRLYEHARHADTVEAYQNYHARGGVRPEVAGELLPRAALRAAQASGSVEALEHFALEHRGTLVEADAQAALRNALLDKLTLARQAGTLEGLERFKTTYPRHTSIATELADARHAVFSTHAARFREIARDGRGARDPGRFFGDLLNYAEVHGPRVMIQFRGQLGETAAKADERVRRDHGGRYFHGLSTLPSHYFLQGERTPNEQASARTLADALQTLFPRDILQFEPGASVPELATGVAAHDLPAFSEPTLWIDYRVEFDGTRIARSCSSAAGSTSTCSS
jgi:hypothetical protein